MKARMIIEHVDSDRNIVLFFDNEGILEGVNFWQGIGDFSIADSFLKIDEKISKYITQIGKSHKDEISFVINDIDQGIWNYFHSTSRKNIEVLSYVEDGKLVLAVRSLIPFDGADFDGDFYYKYFEDSNCDLYISEGISFDK